MRFSSIVSPFTSRLKLCPCILLCFALIAGPRVADAVLPSTTFIPTDFTSLGSNPFTNSGTCTIDTSGSGPVLTLPDSSTITGVVALGSIAVFTFDSISIPTNVTVVGLQNAGSRPVALLSHGDVTIGGIVNVSGAGGKNNAAPGGDAGGAGGAAGPGGGGGGGGGGGANSESPTIAGVTANGVGVGYEGGVGGVGLVNGASGNPGTAGEDAAGGTGGAGGAVDSNGGGTGGIDNDAGGGGAFGGNGGNAIYNETAGGTAYGDLTIFLQGGSGGGGGGGVPGNEEVFTNNGGAGGGGGGGAVEIGAVNQITITGSVLANGGPGGSEFRNGGGGAGGGILLNGDAITFSGSGVLSAAGGAGPVSTGGGGGGRISILAATTITPESTDLTSRVNLAGGSAPDDGNPGNNGVLVTSGAICPTLRVVLNTNDSGPGTLRQAILDANDCPATNTITFAPSSYGTITLTGGELVVSSDLFIDGPGATNVVINGNYPNTTNRVFHIDPGLYVTISGLTITNGNADTGGGIYNDHSTLIVSNCTVSGNSADDGGGGIYSDGESGSATLWVVNSTVSGNSANAGGGIFSDGAGAGGNATLTIVNSTLSGNLGSGVQNAGRVEGNAMLTVLNSTINSNSDLDGGGIWNNSFDGNSTVIIGSTILNAGTNGANIFNDEGTITSLGYNLSSDNGGGYLTGTADQTNTNPMLGPLQFNGGPTPTCAPLCFSPAIDKGTNFSGSATDQRGLPRTFDDPYVPNAVGGDGTDIGAVELQQPCNHPPVAVCTNVTVSAGQQCNVLMASIDGGSYDPDGDLIDLSQSPPGPYQLGTNEVTLTVTDIHGATDSCSGLLIVVDTTPPTPGAAPLVQAQCQASVPAPVGIDNCSFIIGATTTDPTSFTNQGTYTIHWVYTDPSGNTTTQLQSVVIHDTQPPSITCPGNIASNTAPGQCGTIVSWAPPMASDNCSVSNVVCAPASGTFFPAGVTKVTCTATDVGGNTNSCSFNVTVNQSPTCSITVSGNSGNSTTICQGNTVVLTAPNGMKHYLWTGPEQTGAQVQTIVVGTAGTYYCTQEQYYGSTNCCSVTITVEPPPNATITGNAIITNGLPTTLVGPSGVASEYWTGPQNNGLASQSNTVIDPGTYTLHVADSNGCQNTGSVTVANRTPAPCSITVSGDAGDLTICQGLTSILTGANGMSSYLWSGPEQSGATAKSIRVGTQGTYTVQQIDGAGLTNSCSVFLTVHPMPTFNISGIKTICQGTNTTLSGPPGMSQYLWLGPQNNGLEAQSNTVSLAGTYTLTVTDSNGCQNAVSVPVTTIVCP